MQKLKEELLDISQRFSLGIEKHQIANFEDNWENFDSVVILGSEFRIDPITNNIKLSHQVIPELPIIGWGHSRVLAAKEMYDRGFSGTFLTTGGVQKTKNNELVSKAEILKNCMVNLGVNYSKIVPVGKEGNGNTQGNVRDTVEYFCANKSEHLNIGILTNDFHILRSYIMFKMNPFFECLSFRITPIIVEEVLLSRSAKYRTWESQIKQLEGFKKLIEMENNGTLDFIAGSYLPLNN